jgi:hypothetical protein
MFEGTNLEDVLERWLDSQSKLAEECRQMNVSGALNSN